MHISLFDLHFLHPRAPPCPNDTNLQLPKVKAIGTYTVAAKDAEIPSTQFAYGMIFPPTSI